MLIRCTGKLQKEMGLKKTELKEDEANFSYLGSWHANLILIDRKKCVLFCNDKTLFSFIVPGISRTDIKKLEQIFKEWLQCVLADEELPRSVIEAIISEYSEINYAKTNNKSVLGSMNDLAYHYKYAILEAGGVNSYEVPGIIRRLNRLPMGALKYSNAINTLKSLYNKA